MTRQTLIEVQREVIADYARADAGNNAYGRKRKIKAAAIRKLEKWCKAGGYSEGDIDVLLKDALDTYRLERFAEDDHFEWPNDYI